MATTVCDTVAPSFAKSVTVALPAGAGAFAAQLTPSSAFTTGAARGLRGQTFVLGNQSRQVACARALEPTSDRVATYSLRQIRRTR
jgi:hypothetical protein